jgi:hypothetical protein
LSVNVATKYATRTSELLKARKKSEGFTNNDYEWDGVNAIIVTTLTDPTIGNYNANGGANRYGNPTEVEDTQQTFTLSRDRSWTKTIDKKNQQDLLMIKKPGKYLAQATKNVLVPEMDTYNFQTIATAGAVSGYDRDDIVADAATSSSNAHTNFLTINADITDHEAPTEGRVAAMTATYYNYLKQSGFVLDSDSAYRDRKTGNLGQVDGVDVVIVPSNRMPSTTGAIDLLISHPMACVAPEKLVDYTLHDNPPGISGNLLEYRHRYDAFVDTNKANCIGMHAVA